ncbi:hypothetical protein D9M72_588600 [compost metagenome]
MDINGFMADIIIAANQKIGNFFFELVDIILKIIHIHKFMIEPQNIRARRKIQAHHRKIIIVNAKVSAFKIHVLDSCAKNYIVRLCLA